VKHLSDEELVANFARGDRRAMDELVCRYHGKLLDFAFRHLHDREAAADVAQTTLVRLFESAGSYRVKASFRTWLYTIALNLIRDEFRRRSVRKESLSSEMEQGERLMEMRADGVHCYPSPEDAAVSNLSAKALWDAVNTLSENSRYAVVLKFRHDLTYEEIAEVMGVPTGTVKSWVHYALKALRASLQTAECGG
jgi:RNA polymerase sigma-70 factor (ECF subfamily)